MKYEKPNNYIDGKRCVWERERPLNALRRELKVSLCIYMARRVIDVHMRAYDQWGQFTRGIYFMFVL